MSGSSDPNFITALVAGAAAGLVVDITLFPLDTLKTRLQSSEGFWKTGGIKGIYSGLGSVLLGSAPGAATFFCSYESAKKLIQPLFPSHMQPGVHMGAACFGEIMSCIVRVPTEVVKQRTQTNVSLSSWAVLNRTLQSEGFYGLYRGYFSTVTREIPFSLIQFPIWEYLKSLWSSKQTRYVDSWQSSVCGAIAGGIASAITTPLDVAKTRIMLAKKGSLEASGSVWVVINIVYQEKGIRGLFAAFALLKRAWNEVPELVGGACYGLTGIGIGIFCTIYEHKYYGEDIVYKNWKTTYIVYRENDPRALKWLDYKARKEQGLAK